ncbi:hypothetical protein EJ03DRAFT_376724 [Teratosphaeria nubilosa]|uniref:Uncharacterized protein n=1 Tax=Teratosphaeria nubilosa TaxID=161662 RepID=A0A6G1L2H0_9PEZI|nr:hypothetical protein EJ03DRAFT_376724 [Teratosphaeria nubilosa]
MFVQSRQFQEYSALTSSLTSLRDKHLRTSMSLPGDFGSGGSRAGGSGGILNGNSFSKAPSQAPPPLRRTRSGFFEEHNEDEDEAFRNHDSDTIASPEKSLAQTQRLREMQAQQLRHFAAQTMMQRALMVGGPPVLAMPGPLGGAFGASMYPGPWFGGGGRGM